MYDNNHVNVYKSYKTDLLACFSQVEDVAKTGDRQSHDRSSKTGDGRSALWEKWREMSPFLATFDRVY